MAEVTLSAIRADVGGYVGQIGMHEEAAARLAEVIDAALLIDGSVGACGDDLNLVLTHSHGVDAQTVHVFASETVRALAQIAERLDLCDAGLDLVTDACPDTLRDAGGRGLRTRVRGAKIGESRRLRGGQGGPGHLEPPLGGRYLRPAAIGPRLRDDRRPL